MRRQVRDLRIRVARSEVLGGTRTPNLLIRRLWHASLLPGHMPLGLRGCRSLSRIVSRCCAVLSDQIQTNRATLLPSI